MIFRNVIIADAASEVITATEARDHLRESSSSDSLIALYLKAARQSVEQELISVKIGTQTWELQMDSWFTDDFGSPVIITQYPNSYGYVTLPASPLQSVVNIFYDDVSSEQQTLGTAAYQVDTASSPGRIRWTGNLTLPGLANKPNAVRIRYTAGYADGNITPFALKAAILMRLGSLWENRQEETLQGSDQFKINVDRLIAPYRIPV